MQDGWLLRGTKLYTAQGLTRLLKSAGWMGPLHSGTPRQTPRPPPPPIQERAGGQNKKKKHVYTLPVWIEDTGR